MSTSAKIKTKAEFFALWEAGVLGNRPHLFRDAGAAFGSGFPLVGFRELGKAGGGKWQRVPHVDILETARQWTAAGRKFIMDSATYPADDSKITLQGEVCRTYRGLEGTLGYCPGYAMRPAMAAGLLKPYGGAAVRTLLDRWMDPSSQDDLRDLLDLYPEATVEFTCFSIDTGVFPGRNTLFWECRGY